MDQHMLSSATRSALSHNSMEQVIAHDWQKVETFNIVHPPFYPKFSEKRQSRINYHGVEVPMHSNLIAAK